MKTKIYIALLIILTGAGCKRDLLETVPNDRITSNIFWKQEKDAVLAANAIYTFMDGVSIFSFDAISDIAHSNLVFLEEANIERGTYDAFNLIVINEWGNDYKGIHAANYFLENIDKVPSADTALINSLKGQVRVLRAYQYLKLVFLFGDVPLVTKSLTIEEGKNLVRTPSTEIWDFINAELTAAAGQLPLAQADKGRITKGAALALNARAMLYAGRYQAAAAAAKAVMDLHAYSLYPEYKKLFSYGAENNAEVILDKQFIKDIYPSNIFTVLATPSLANDGLYFVPTETIVNAYEMANGRNISDPASGFDPYHPYQNRDPRLAYSVFFPGSTLPNGKTFNSLPGSGTPDALGFNASSSTTGFTIRKYVNADDLSDPLNSGINIILLRYAEVLLTYAEAKIENRSVDQSVYDAINEVRQRADVNMPAITPGKTDEQLREIVRHERMVELAFEGQRFFDIRRWKVADQLMDAPIHGMTYANANGQLIRVNVQFKRSFQAGKDYLWPIPQKERDLNKHLTQNPGW